VSQKRQPHYTDAARSDLSEIWDHIAENNPVAADRVVGSILEKAVFHAQFPKLGRARNDLRPGLRSAAVSPYVLFFHEIGDTIDVIRILHGKRDMESIFADG